MNPAHVLLVEDNELNRALVRAILTRTSEPRLRGAVLTEAETLGAARAALAGDAVFDLILLDVHLPDGSGLSVAQELAGRGARPPIVALTAAALPREQAAALDAGCDTFLAKPYTSGELVAAMVKLLS